MAKKVTKSTATESKVVGKAHRKPTFRGINSPIDFPKGFRTSDRTTKYLLGKARDHKGKVIDNRPMVGPKSRRGYCGSAISE